MLIIFLIKVITLWWYKAWGFPNTHLKLFNCIFSDCMVEFNLSNLIIQSHTLCKMIFHLSYVHKITNIHIHFIILFSKNFQPWYKYILLKMIQKSDYLHMAKQFLVTLTWRLESEEDNSLSLWASPSISFNWVNFFFKTFTKSKRENYL